MKKWMIARLEQIQASRVGTTAGVLGTAMMATAAHAATTGGSGGGGIDLGGVTGAFGKLNTALTTVGGLIITAAATAIVFKWVKGMIFS